MSLERQNVNAKLDPDTHRALKAICDAEGVTIAEFVENLLVPVILDLWSSAPSISCTPSRDARPPDSGPSRGRATWQARRDDGMARAQDHAEEDVPGWTEAAAEFLRDYAQTVAGPFLVEQARAASRHRVPKPANGKAWGPAAVMAVKRGWIVKAGFGPASSSNGSPKTLFCAKAWAR